jgi:hypothetical protein
LEHHLPHPTDVSWPLHVSLSPVEHPLASHKSTRGWLKLYSALRTEGLQHIMGGSAYHGFVAVANVNMNQALTSHHDPEKDVS